MRVLIADDEREVGRSLADLVRFCNHQIVGVVASGLEAIQAYNRYHPDLVLMDYRMPKLNGATACRNILSKDPTARVILVSGWSPSDEASVSGAIGMLPKPVSLEKLQAALQGVAETLPALSPAEMPFPEVSFPQDSIDHFEPVPQPLPIDPPSLEMPIPEACFQPEPPADSIAHSQFIDQPIPSSELQAANFPPVSTIPSSLEISFPVDALQDDLQQTGAACALNQEKISRTPRSPRRRAQRVR
jgi:CheY-like chemotaxis protein